GIRDFHVTGVQTCALPISVVDLATGDADKIVVPGDGSALPLAWSPDSTLLAYVVTDGPADPYTGSALSGELGLLDVTTVEAQPRSEERRVGRERRSGG